MTHSNSPGSRNEEQDLSVLLRSAGGRTRPPEAVHDAVYAAVRAEWRDVVAARARARRRNQGWALAATVAAAAVALWVAMPLQRPADVMVAELVRISGPVSIDEAAGRSPAPIVAGAEISTGRGGRAALQVAAASVRIDEGSLVTFAAADRLVLHRGAVYVDSGRVDAESLQIETPLGTVAHLGTQYETRLVGESLRVSVREGRVALRRDDGPRIESAAGERLTVGPGGVVKREPVGRSDAYWAWAGEIAPAFEIDQRPLAEFLRWVSRETGKEISYASPAIERQAEGMILRGSVTGLTPTQALTAVLATTQLQSVERDGALLIEAKTE